MGKLGQLNTAHFRAKVRKYGRVPAKWLRKVGLCPNTHMSAFSGYTPDMSCALCGGTGELYEEMALPTSGATGGRMLFYQNMSRRRLVPVELEAGELICTFFEDEYPLAEGDLLEIDSREHDFSDQITCSGTGATDRLRYVPVTRILAAYIQSGKLTPGTHYSLNAAQTGITWAGGVAGNQNATIRYRYRPRYVVKDGSIHHRERATNGDLFPSRVILRLWQQNQMDVKAANLD